MNLSTISSLTPFAKARELFGDLQALARGGAPAGEIAFLTGEMTEPEEREKLAGLEVGSLLRVLG